MKRFDSKLKISVSAFALLCGGALACAPAMAVTYDGDETGVVINSDITGDLIISSTGSITPDGLVVNGNASGNLSNAGLVEAVASGTVPDVDVDVIALDFNGTVGGSVVNSGVINAEASATSKAAITSGDHFNEFAASASATGVDIESVTGNVTNSGVISARATANQVYDVGTVETPVTEVTVDDYAYAYAIGLEVDQASGIITNAAEASITATAKSSSTYNVVADGDFVQPQLSGVEVIATATGVYVGSGSSKYAFSNSGNISADASAALVVNAKATASEDTAYITVEAEGSAYAYGVLAYGDSTGFTNTGSITATAATTQVETLSAVGTSGTIYVTNTNTATATGVRVGTLKGTFSNSGTIAATASADLSLTADATGTTSYAYLEPDDYVSAEAIGVKISSLTGSFSNTVDGSIAANSSAKANYDVSAVAPIGAWVDLDSVTAQSTGTGVAIQFGEYSFANDGAISAVANGAMSVIALASGGETSASVSASVSLEANAYGAVLGGSVKGLTNTGTISAAATASSVVALTAKGVTDAAVELTQEVSAFAVGVRADSVKGNVSNSGTISASADATASTNVAASFAGKAGDVAVDSEVYATAVGVSAHFSAPGEDEAPRTFTNSGTISATAKLSVTTAVPASADPAPVVEMTASAEAIGAFLTGSLSTVVNSGTISAAVEAAGATDAFAVGLSLQEAVEGLEINNSGKIEASISGTAADSVATALRIGPAFGMDDDNEGGGELEPTALGVITVTNSGTISATNTAGGGSYGIFAAFAPDPLVINQLGGVISGATAIEIDNENADTLNWSGGSIKGLVSADATDIVNVLQALGKDGKGVATTVTAGVDFSLDGAGQLNVGGGKGAPVTFEMNGIATNIGATTVSTDGNLVMGPTSQINGGTFTMQPDSKLTFIFTPADAGLISTTGDATVDGTLGAVALPGLYGDKGSHVVVESDTKVVGTFDNVTITGDTLLIDFSAAVHEKDVTISWKRTPFNEVAGLTINSTSVATALEDGYDPTRPASKNAPELNDILAGLFTLTDAEKYDRVLNSWSGSEHAQVMRAAANLSEPYLMTVGEHLNDIRRAGAPDGQVVMLRPKGSSTSIAPLSAAGASTEDSRFAFWGRAFGRWSDTRGDIEADGYDENTYGAVLGFDFIVSPNVVVGVVGGYTDDDIDFDDGDAGKIKRWTIGGYFSATIDQFYIDGSLSYASDDYRVERTIIYGGTSCLAFNCTTGAASKYDGDGFLGHAELGYIFAVGEGIGLQPFAGINYSSIDSGPFAETGGGDLGLDVLDGTGKSLQSRLGARLTGEWGSGGSTKWFPELRVEWRHEFEDDPAWIVAAMNGLPDNPFVAIGSEVTSDLAVVGAGVTAVMSNGVGIFLDYQGAFGSGYSGHVIQGGVRFKF